MVKQAAPEKSFKKRFYQKQKWRYRQLGVRIPLAPFKNQRNNKIKNHKGGTS